MIIKSVMKFLLTCLPSGLTVAAPDAFGRIPGVVSKLLEVSFLICLRQRFVPPIKDLSFIYVLKYPQVAVKKWNRSILSESNFFCKYIISIIRKVYALILLTISSKKNGNKSSCLYA